MTWAAADTVPIDDNNTMNYCIEYLPARPLNEDEMKRSKEWRGIHAENLAGSERGVLNKDNNYLVDRDRQRAGKSFTGIKGIGMQDCAIQESMGPVANRSIEHLGIGDTVIIKLRRLLLQTLRDFEKGMPLPALDPASYRVRSALFAAPEECSFGEVADNFVRVSSPAR